MNLTVQVVVRTGRDCVSGCDRESRGKYRKGSQSEEVEEFGRHDVTLRGAVSGISVKYLTKSGGGK